MSVVAPTTALARLGRPDPRRRRCSASGPGPLAFAGIAVSLVAVVLITRERVSEHHVPRRPARSSLLALGGGAIFGLFFVFLHQTGSEAGLWPLLAARLTSVPLLPLLVARPAEGGFALARAAPPRPARAASAAPSTWRANICYLLALRTGCSPSVAALTGPLPGVHDPPGPVPASRERLHLPQVVGLGVAACAAVLIAV